MPPSGSPPTADLYRLLDVSPTATTAEIEAAWRSAIRRAHPDVSQGPGATALAAGLNLARDWLTDPDGRAAYDRSRRTGTSRMPGAGSAGSAAGFRASAASGSRDATDVDGAGPWGDERFRGRGGHAEAAPASSLAGVVGLLGIMAFFVALMAGITETAAGVVALLASVVAMGAALLLALRGPASPGR